ncbi:hypothetical protein ACUOFC_67040, partial [Escherichia sp. TWPC-MK]
IFSRHRHIAQPQHCITVGVIDITRLQNDRLAQQAEALENQGKWAQAAALQRQRLALDPGSVWITYRLSQDLWQA